MIINEIEKALKKVKFDKRSSSIKRDLKSHLSYLKFIGEFKEIEKKIQIDLFVAGRMSAFKDLEYGMEYFNKLSDAYDLAEEYFEKFKDLNI